MSSNDLGPGVVFNAGDNARVFINLVEERARQLNFGADNARIADAVSDRFEGDALRWYVGLEEETRQDWTKLKAALLRQYPPTP